MASAADIAKSLAGIIGENDEESTVRHYIDSGFAPLNFASSADFTKGFPAVGMIEVAGPPSAGKTAIATQAMASAQKQGGIAMFMDHERLFSFDLAEKLGLNVKPGNFVFRKPKTFEESLQMVIVASKHLREKKLISKNAPICAVFDSLAQMVPKSALLDSKTGKERLYEDRNMNDNTALARATSAHFPAFAQHCEEYGNRAIFLNQMRTKIGVLHGDPRKTTGGEAPEFAFSQRLWLSASQIKKGTDIVGQEVTGLFKKNKVARPFMTAKWRFMFQDDGTGKFDRERSMVDFLDGLGVLEKQGNYVVWEGVKLYPEALARKIEKDGAMKKLEALIPKAYEPKIVAEVDGEEEEAA